MPDLLENSGLGFTHRPLSSSFLGLPYGILNINHKKELVRSLWVFTDPEPPCGHQQRTAKAETPTLHPTHKQFSPGPSENTSRSHCQNQNQRRV